VAVERRGPGLVEWFPVGFVTNDPGQEDDGELQISVSLPGEMYDPEAGGEPPSDVEVTTPADGDEAVLPARSEEADEELVVDLGDWSEVARAAAEERLRESGIPHWWVGTAVHGSVADAAAIDDVLDELDADAVEPLDPDEDQVAYDMSEWDDDRLATLGIRLDDAGLPFSWDGEELFVYAADEDRVDEIIDAVEHPDELPAEDEDAGPESDEVSAALLGDLFVAADKLQHDPKDHEQAAAVLLASERVSEDAMPYGLAKNDWRHLCERVENLAEALDQDKLDEEAVVTAARDLRTSLRPYV
jgi:hypothetical protein